MTKFEAAAVRDAIIKAISVMGLGTAHAYFTFAGILPLFLPDGTRVVILPDIHAPAHNGPLMWAIEKFLWRYKPHVVILVGDLADLFAMSRHPKALRAVVNAQMEFNVTRRVTDRLIEAAQGAFFIIINGNHEDRYYRLLQDLAPQLGGLIHPTTREPLSVHSQLGYKADDNVLWIYGTEERGGFEGGLLLNNDLGVHHGIVIRPKAGFSPLADMDRWMRSIAHGHTHRFGFVARDLRVPSKEYPAGILRGYELGVLADMDHSFMAYSRQMWPNWHYGFGAGLVHNGIVHLQPVPISPVPDERGRDKLTFVWNGEEFTESDR